MADAAGTLTTNRAREYDAAARDAARRASVLDASDITARMRATVDALWTHLSPSGVSWVGFYLPARDQNGQLELILGPSRDKPACSPIGLHGVCGQSLVGRCVRIIRDVADLGGAYVACDPRDRSEIVIPVEQDGACVAVLDLDSHEVGRFGEADEVGLRQVLRAAGLSGAVRGE
ncbi:MAG: GAF domain-containing protein [Phycisphaerae bacterium]|nr:GAF domain-containing protein [Phycisphaerae bacterium]